MAKVLLGIDIACLTTDELLCLAVMARTEIAARNIKLPDAIVEPMSAKVTRLRVPSTAIRRDAEDAAAEAMTADEMQAEIARLCAETNTQIA